jgi:hypothetical protein
MIELPVNMLTLTAVGCACLCCHVHTTYRFAVLQQKHTATTAELANVKRTTSLHTSALEKSLSEKTEQ